MPRKEWDPATGKYKKINYSKMSEQEIIERVNKAEFKSEEMRYVVEELLPPAEAQKLLNAKAIDAYELLIKIIKRAPELLGKIL